jgi:type IV pilus assembly protein PilY1
VGFLAGLLVLPSAGYSERPDFAQEPLFIGSEVAPNLLFIIDDSGSMAWEYMPDRLSGGEWEGWSYTYYDEIASTNGGFNQDGEDAYFPFYFSSRVNKIWYNPDVTYRPPMKADGTGRMPSSSYTSAPINGYDSNSSKRNLNNAFTTSRYSVLEGGGFYWQFQSSDACEADPEDDDCYTYVSVNDLSAEEQTNFANWFSYYNTRVKAARAGVSEAFYNLPSNFRLGWGRLNFDNERTNTVDGAEGVRAVESGVREFTSSRRESFLNWLYDSPASGNTPLRRALEGAGKYFEGSKQAWSDKPGEAVSDTNPARECRLSYSILMSDGYYNGSRPSSLAQGADDEDGETISNEIGDSYKYVPEDPFTDGEEFRTLADVAMYYWKRDLRTDIDNYVPTSNKNPAFWQHMVSYTVGLGVTGSVDPDAAFEAIETGDSIDWWGGTSDEDKVNDMLHAAVNSRGGFFSAADPETFAEELTGTVGDIIAEAGSSTAVEFDVSSFQEGALIFSSQFDPNGWTGDLKAVELGGTDTPEVPNIEEAIEAGNGWSAGDILDGRDLGGNDRVIITYADGSAVPFRWDDLSTDQKSDLGYGGVSEQVATQRLDFIRGDRSLEGSGDFRKRGSRLGSIVNSSPEFVGKPRAIWPDADPFGQDSDRFSDFVETNKNRSPVVYVGSNDGMLHGFSGASSGGQEILAYIPEFIYDSSSDNAGLHFISDPDYQHRYYVDLEIRQQDIYTKGKRANGNLTNKAAWRSVIFGGGRAGAKGIFALDVTDPGSFSEADAEKIVLWEFAESDDNRFGYVIQAPVIGMAKWGESDIRWTAFVSNGYNSNEASTGIFMLDIEGGMDGSWDSDDINYIEFDAEGDGLSPLTALDTTGDYLIDRVYAGDLDGNLWVADGTNGSWESAYTASGPQPLFTAASNQPITAAPAVAANNDAARAGNEPNLLVFFGTGQYLERNDVDSTATQSVYGIWDKGLAGLNRSTLEPRTLDEGTLDLGENVSAQVRYSNGDKLDYSAINGWYADLDISGERAVVSPQVRGEFLYLNTIIPDQNPCLGGGSGWVLAFGLDGRTPESRAFLEFDQIVTGYKLNSMPNQSTILGNFRFTPSSDGDEPVDVVEIPPLSGAVAGAGRRGWNELIE